ncbi:MAG: hypothetical protein RIR69_1609 [Actinomycetota bacterium]|jgi:hypothetical protein
MKKLFVVLGYSCVGASVIAGLVAYFVPAVIFFSRGDALLGFIQLFFPPAAIVLPWIISPQLGLIALASLVLFPLGAFLASLGED